MSAQESAQSAEKAQSRWAAKHYTKPCDSCGARAGEPCRTASGYVTMRHASRRRADASTPPGQPTPDGSA